MDLNTSAIHDVVHPTAAFARRAESDSDHPPIQAPVPTWSQSQLNPRNRINSLEPLANPLWRIDGCTGLGTQFYSVPLFFEKLAPMRFDVFIPEEAAISPLLRRLLDLDAAFHTKDVTRVRRLGIARYIVRALQHWTLEKGVDWVRTLYETFPFGSRIIFNTLELNVRNISILVAPMHNLERQLLSISRLHEVLGLPLLSLPEAMDLGKLNFIQQLQDSVCLVHIDGRDDGPWILKALTSGSKYLYHELKALINMPPHPHVTARPRYLVTKHCRFGGKMGVVGFILPFYAGGSLRDSLPLMRIQNRLSFEQQLEWAVQLTSAVVHVREQGKMFYPDLRLDNVVLSAAKDIVMVDFEQRGVWCEFAAPEVNAIDYIRTLAEAEPYQPETPKEPGIPEAVRLKYARIMSDLLPHWEVLGSGEEYIPSWSNHHGYKGFNVAWLCLSAEEQEAAEVFMLGRVLWCLFEGQSAPQPGAFWQSYAREPDIEFPNYRQSPPALRQLIDACTAGRRTLLSSLIARRGSRLVLRTLPSDARQNADEVLRVAKDWWTQEVAASEKFLFQRDAMKAKVKWRENYFGRPKLRDVLAALEGLSRVG